MSAEATGDPSPPLPQPDEPSRLIGEAADRRTKMPDAARTYTEQYPD